jgi:chromosome partitioning protein
VSSVQRQLESELLEAKVPRFRTSLAERLAYKAIFVERLSLAELGEHKVGNLEAAYQNIHELVEELVETLREIGKKEVSK